jgi:heme/copper-type cytochrome/quinol oxidase subunit 3
MNKKVKTILWISTILVASGIVITTVALAMKKKTPKKE